MLREGDVVVFVGVEHNMHTLCTQNTKSLDGSSNLLAWVASHVLKCHGRLLAEEVPAVLHPHTRVACSELAAVLDEVREGVAAAKAWYNEGVVVKVDIGEQPSGLCMVTLQVDEARGLVGQGVGMLDQACDAGTRMLHETEQGYTALLQWYGESTASWSNDAAFWHDIAGFAECFTAVCKEVYRERIE